MQRTLLLTLICVFLLAIPAQAAEKGIWISQKEIGSLPMHGAAWDNLKKTADEPTGTPDLSDQDNSASTRTLAKALVYARTGEEKYRTQVVEACLAAIGTEAGGRTLALGRELAGFVIAADIVKLPQKADALFRKWLKVVPDVELENKTLRTTHEIRPNNWGTLAGGSRAAVAAYLGNKKELKRCAKVFKGWLGDTSSYNGFRYGKLWWQADPSAPVGINPLGAIRDGHFIDGILPDDQRRSGGFTWPPPKENYVYSALQGVLVQAVILHRAGFDVWNWEDKAILRAFRWLHLVADYPAEGDDQWQPHVVNYYYGTDFPAPTPAKPGKIVGWTDWTHGAKAKESN